MFIALEGIDGTGKTTVSRIVAENLLREGFKVFLTKEPTESLVLDYESQSDRTPGNAISLFFRFTEDRFRHQEIIDQKLKNGNIVITDRYILSSFAYQGALIEPVFGSSERTIEWMKSVSGIIRVMPDITFYLDLSLERAMERMGNRAELTGFEEKKYLSDVKRYYEQLVGGSVKKVDASKSVKEVTGNIYSLIREKL